MQEVKWVQRAGRSLIGWMTPHEAQLALAGRMVNTQQNGDHVTRARRAREIVAARPAGVDPSGVISPAPRELNEYIGKLQAYPGAAIYFNEGWTVQLADLRKVCSFQPGIVTENAARRTAGVLNGDFASLASISLPVSMDAPLPGQFDPVRQAYVFSSTNPNLRVMGNFNAPVGPGLTGFGFAVGISPSFMQVVKFQGRYLLRDGYHRAFAFLKAGIHVVPTFVREVGANDEIGVPAGMLPQGAYLGDRPPLLPDFLNDEVAADVTLPAVQKMIVVQAIELTPMVLGAANPDRFSLPQGPSEQGEAA